MIWIRWAIVALSVQCLFVVFPLGLLASGLHADALRDAPGHYRVDVHVDKVSRSCFKNCRYTSIGHYTDSAGRRVDEVRVIPRYDSARSGVIVAIASPGHPRTVVDDGYNGTGNLVFAAIMLPIGLIGNGVALRYLRARLRRHTQSKRLRAGAPGSVLVRGILHGPAIPPVQGPTDIRLDPTQIVSVDPVSGQTWTLDLSTVTGAEFMQRPTDTGGAILAYDWRTTTLITTAGTYHLTCSYDHTPLLKRLLDNRIPKPGDSPTL